MPQKQPPASTARSSPLVMTRPLFPHVDVFAKILFVIQQPQIDGPQPRPTLQAPLWRVNAWAKTPAITPDARSVVHCTIRYGKRRGECVQQPAESQEPGSGVAIALGNALDGLP